MSLSFSKKLLKLCKPGDTDESEAEVRSALEAFPGGDSHPNSTECHALWTDIRTLLKGKLVFNVILEIARVKFREYLSSRAVVNRIIDTCMIDE